jgi:DDE superfamily endonuclease
MVAEDGTVRTEKGLYLIVDGGYHKWKCLQCPMKHTSLPKDASRNKWVESVRKDIECVFGMLKGRFRCLKLPIYYHDKETIDSMFSRVVFFTICCVLLMDTIEDGGRM